MEINPSSSIIPESYQGPGVYPSGRRKGPNFVFGPGSPNLWEPQNSNMVGIGRPKGRLLYSWLCSSKRVWAGRLSQLGKKTQVPFNSGLPIPIWGGWGELSFGRPGTWEGVNLINLISKFLVWEKEGGNLIPRDKGAGKGGEPQKGCLGKEEFKPTRFGTPKIPFLGKFPGQIEGKVIGGELGIKLDYWGLKILYSPFSGKGSISWPPVGSLLVEPKISWEDLNLMEGLFLCGNFPQGVTLGHYFPRGFSPRFWGPPQNSLLENFPPERRGAD